MPKWSRDGTRRAVHILLFAHALGALLCCAAEPAPPPRTAAAPAVREPLERPELSALPPLAEGQSADTPQTHQGLLAARATLETVMPEAPADRSYASLQAWVDSDVVAWVQRRRAQTAETRDRFGLEGAPSSSERALGHAVVGLIHEDTAFSLTTIPSPTELESEPEIAQIYREVVGSQADTFLKSALAEFRDCAEDASESPSDMRDLAEFCHARAGRLQQRFAPGGAVRTASVQ